MAAVIRIQRSGQRDLSEQAGIHTWHVYSAGAVYDPERMGFGALIGHDEHRLDPGAGFPAHRHRDMDILTWVLAGVLRHEDDTGWTADVHPGQVLFQSAGTGITHVERNPSNTEATRFVQMLLQPSVPPGPPRHRLEDAFEGERFPFGLLATDLLDVQMQALRIADGGTVALNDELATHVHVTRGAVQLNDWLLVAGDSAEVEPGELATLVAAASSEVLLLTMPPR